MKKRILTITIIGCIFCFYQTIGLNVLASAPAAFAETNETSEQATLPQDPGTNLEPSGDDTDGSDEMVQTPSEDEETEDMDETDAEDEGEYDNEEESENN